MSEQEEKLGGIKAGDVVYIDSRWAGLRKLTVDRVTATQVVCGDERFRIKDGKGVGDSGYDCRWIQPETDDLKERHFRQWLIKRIKSVAWEKQNTLVLREVNNALQKPEGEK